MAMFSVVNLLLLTAYTVTSVAGLTIMKLGFTRLSAARAAGEGLTPPLLQLGGGATLYVLSFALWMVILSRFPLTVAYPVAIGLTLTFTALLGVFLLHESVTPANAIGMLLIFAGVALVVRP